MPNMDVPYQLVIMVSAFTLQNFIQLYELYIPISRTANIAPSRADCDMFNDLRNKEMDRVQLQIAREIWNSVGRGIYQI